MNETRGNSRTKPMRGGLKGGEMNSLKDSEKTNECILNICCFFNITDNKTTAQINNTLIISDERIEEFMEELDTMIKNFLYKNK